MTETHQPTDLTRFQLDTLRVLEREGPLYGLAIKDGIERRYDEEINHGRLYPNLDDLVDANLIAKSQRDLRTNEYELTDDGKRLLDERRRWFGLREAPEPVAPDGGDQQ